MDHYEFELSNLYKLVLFWKYHTNIIKKLIYIESHIINSKSYSGGDYLKCGFRERNRIYFIVLIT